MVGSIWTKSLIASLAWAGLAWAQQPQTNANRPAPNPPSATSPDRVITVQEPNKPAQKCKILKTWRTPEGAQAYQVQALGSGELMTIVESGPVTTVPGSRAGTRMQAMATRIFHWGRNQTPPPGTPMPPPEVVQTVPAPKVRPQVVTTKVVCEPTPKVVCEPTPKVERPRFFARLFHKDTASECECKPTVVEVKTESVAKKSEAPKERLVKVVAPAGSDKKQPEVTEAKPVEIPKERLVKVVAPGSDKKQPEITESKPEQTKGPSITALPKAPVLSAPPSDWRKSWGKPDEPKSTAAPKVTPSETKVMVTPSETKVMPTETKVKTVMTLPHANTNRPDPLQVPDRYTRQPVDGLPKIINQEPAKPSAERQEIKITAATPEPTLQVPAGMQSVITAGVDAPGGVRYIPVPVVTIPDLNHPPMPMAQVPRPPQPFPERQDGQGNAFVNVPPNKALGATPTTYDPGLVNAFTAMPSNEQVAKATNAFTAPEASSLASLTPQAMGPGGQPMMQRSPNAAMAAQLVPAMGTPAPQGLVPAGYQMALSSQEHLSAAEHLERMQALLHDSIYPSHREWAVESLAATVDWHSHPQVVQIMLTAARNDPAATVRAACVRCLCKMNANTVPVVTTIKTLKADPDPRVRQEADKALSMMGPDGRAYLP